MVAYSGVMSNPLIKCGSTSASPYYKGKTFEMRCLRFTPNNWAYIHVCTHIAENIHGGQLNTKDGYRLGGTGLRSQKKPPSPKRSSCKGRPFYLAFVSTTQSSELINNSSCHTAKPLTSSNHMLSGYQLLQQHQCKCSRQQSLFGQLINTLVVVVVWVHIISYIPQQSTSTAASII